MKKYLLWFIAAQILFLFACESASEPEAPVEYSLDITNAGLSFAPLGVPLDSLDLPVGSTIEEVLNTEGGYQWRAMNVFLPNGEKAIIEGDFVDEGDPGDKLPTSAVNRVLVDGPEYVSPEGIRVGQSLSDLKNTFGDSSLVAVYIADYQSIDVFAPGVNRLHFNLSDPSRSVAKAARDSTKEVPLDIIPEESKIVSIVVSF